MFAASLGLLGVLTNGCSSGDGTQVRPVTLRVHLGLFGGPARPDGSMALSNAPDPSAPIVLTGRDGTTQTRRTHRDGIATFSVLPGRYTVESTTCGHGPQSVVIRANRLARVEVRCDVP
jgi:hypothetical protein